MIVVAVVALVFALVVLTRAADAFVLGAARLAAGAHLSPVLVGAVIIGFGTSLPELLVSGLAAGQDDLGLGVGNVVGSNVANLTLVLGVAALISPMRVPRHTVRREAPMMVASIVGFAYVVQDGLTRIEGYVLLGFLVVALVVMVVAGRGKPPDDDLIEMMEDDVTRGREVWRTIIGLVLTAASAQLLVWAAGEIADELDLSGGFVGFSIVALGTSAPELVTAFAAARRGQAELVLGNLLGSNMFNSLGVGGAIAVIGPGDVADTTLATTGSLVMVGVAVAAFAFCRSGYKVVRLEALVLLVTYGAAIALLSNGS